jgi:hypothetical protein
VAIEVAFLFSVTTDQSFNVAFRVYILGKFVFIIFFMHLSLMNIAGNELGGFRCSAGAAHLQCNGCRGMMPIRSNISIPQKCMCQF